jgi:glycosyltransferase involved in cell wall biosynthesis
VTAAEPDGQLSDRVPVSVVMPVLNEERHLEEAVRAVLEQDHEGPIEVVLALGPSTDATDEVAARLCAEHPQVRTVTSPTGRTPSSLNLALAASRHPVVVRVDGHALLDRHYVRTAVELLRTTGAANVGGLMAANGSTDFERAVAAAMTSTWGVGSSRFHTGGEAGEADTVYLGVFRREWLDRVGGYDEDFTRAQDWEMNHRIRKAGGLVWFSPRLHVDYRPRGTLRALARQYRDYGRWRRVVSRTHTGTVNLRYLAPPVALVASAVGLVGALVTPWALVLPGGYVLVVLVGTVSAGRGLGPRSRALLPAVLATMHMSWAWGFLTSPASLVPAREQRADGEPALG